ncbi:MAG: AAA family ATPase [Planctomycetota bacterium]|nr:AAA family ATPase [Planctomycetota bacterium]
MRRIAIINQKGGVGKTTTTANLGAALAIQGRRVVVVDMDAQANLSLSLGIEAKSGSPTSYTVLTGTTKFGAAIRDTALPRLRIVPANIDLSGAELELAAAMGREFILRDAIREWVEDERKRTGRAPADYVLFDCPPSLGLLSINALATAGEVLITLQTEFLALQGMSKLVEVVQLLKKRLNPELVVTGIVPCLYDSRLRLAREVLGEIRTYFKGQVFPHPVRANVKLAEAPSFGQTVFEYAPDSNGADDYMRVAREVVARETRDPELAGLPAFDEKARLPLKEVTPPRKPPPRPPPRKPAASSPVAQPEPTAAPAARAPEQATSPTVREPEPRVTITPAPRGRSTTATSSDTAPARDARIGAAPPASAHSDAPTRSASAAPKNGASTGNAAHSAAPAREPKSHAVQPPPVPSPVAKPAARAEPRVLRAEDVPPLPPDAFEILSILPTDS